MRWDGAEEGGLGREGAEKGGSREEGLSNLNLRAIWQVFDVATIRNQHILMRTGSQVVSGIRHRRVGSGRCVWETRQGERGPSDPYGIQWTPRSGIRWDPVGSGGIHVHALGSTRIRWVGLNPHVTGSLTNSVDGVRGAPSRLQMA